MSFAKWIITIGAAGAALYYITTIVRGLRRLAPQVRNASRKARQQNALLRVESASPDEILFKARGGDSAAQTRAGLMYAKGEGLPRDSVKAFMCFKTAAEAGFVEAQYYLGLAYHHGRGVQVDLSQAQHWYRLAAASGSAAAQCNLGGLALRAELPDWLFAADWFLRAACQDNFEAKESLEWLLRNVTSAAAETVQHLDRYRRAADEGDINAMFLLGWCCEHGFMTTLNYQEAIRWYQMSEEAGHLYAHDRILNLLASRRLSH